MATGSETGTGTRTGRPSLVISPHKPKPLESRPTPRWQGILLRGTLALLLLFPALFVGFRIFVAQLFAHEVRQLRAQGMPTNDFELQDWYMAGREGANSANLVYKALKALPRYARVDISDVPFFGRTFTWPGGPLEASLVRESSAALQAAQPFLELMHEATQEDLQYAYEISPGPEQDYSLQFSGWNGAARLLLAETVLEANAGNSDQAVDGLMRLFRMADSLKREPMSFGQRRRQTTIHMFIEGLEQVLGRTRLGEDQLKTLDASLQSIDVRQNVHNVLLGERAMSLQQNRWRLLYDEAGERGYLDILYGPNRLALQYLEMMREAEKLLKLDSSEALTVWRHFMGEDEGIAATLLDRRLFSPYVYLTLEARIACARAAIALERALLKDPDPAIELPEDPFTHKKMLFHAENASYRIYSVGPNEKDDGGDTVVYTQESNTRQQPLPLPEDWGVSIIKS